ncbi:serine hydrolase domain-containing protein [Actinoallomurus sp. NPDC050550]|uniref:serine hydrolase domain-containing protein n=1 Tax=Actinoallomurus sp. NPDC050550 TaxID=3154937 RepID=UPI00340AAD80
MGDRVWRAAIVVAAVSWLGSGVLRWELPGAVGGSILAVVSVFFVGARIRKSSRRRIQSRRFVATGGEADGLAQTLVTNAGVWGASVVVARAVGEGRTQLGAAGRSGRPDLPVSGSTRFEIASLTKLFTGLLLADLVVRGEVELDAPVSRYLPGYVNDPGGQVTLSSLATHTSGLPRLPRSPRWLLYGSVDPYRGLDRAWLAKATHRVALGEPGVRLYSNLGYMLLGEALAEAADGTWPELVEQRICAVLGMTSTSMVRDEHTARGHDHIDLPTSYWNMTGLPGAGALYSNAEDLARFLSAQLAPDTTPLGEAIRLSRRPHARGSGLGWILADDGVAWHNGGTGGFGAFIAIRQGHAGIAALTNTEHEDRLDHIMVGHLRALCLAADASGERKKTSG